MLDKNQIFIVNGTDYAAMTNRLLEECGLAGIISSRDKRIGIKPNLVSASPASYGATTHPEIIDALIGYLQDNGFNNICVLEGAWVGEKTQNVLEVNGTGNVCKQRNVPFIDTQKDKAVKMDCSGIDLEICRSVLDIDFLINVPVLKGHCQTRIT